MSATLCIWSHALRVSECIFDERDLAAKQTFCENGHFKIHILFRRNAAIVIVWSCACVCMWTFIASSSMQCKAAVDDVDRLKWKMLSNNCELNRITGNYWLSICGVHSFGGTINCSYTVTRQSRICGSNSKSSNAIASRHSVWAMVRRWDLVFFFSFYFPSFFLSYGAFFIDQNSITIIKWLCVCACVSLEWLNRPRALWWVHMKEINDHATSPVHNSPMEMNFLRAIAQCTLTSHTTNWIDPTCSCSR